MKVQFSGLSAEACHGWLTIGPRSEATRINVRRYAVEHQRGGGVPGRYRVLVVLRAFGRGVAYRRGIAGLIVVVSALASASVGVGPNYREAAGISALRSRLVTVSPAASGVEVAGSTWPGNSPDRALAKLVPRLPLAAAVIRGMSVGGMTTLQVPHGPVVEFSSLTWRQGDCLHVVFRFGRCPRTRNEIALPVGAARLLHARLGGPIVPANLDRSPYGFGQDIDNHDITQKQISASAQRSYRLKDKVVGLFDVPASQSQYWFGQNIDAPVVSAEGDDGPQVNVVTALVPRVALTSLPPPFVATVTIDEPLAWSRATPAEVPPLLTAITGLRRSLTSNLSLFTSVPGFARTAATDRVQLGHLIAIADVQLLVLVLLVLVVVLAASVSLRRAELVLATLEGRRPFVTALRMAVEPILLVAVGVVAGVALSVPLARLASRAWLRPGTPVHLQAESLLAAVAVAVVAGVVTVVLGLRAASRSLTEQLSEDVQAAAGRAGAWIDIVVITLAGAGLVELFEADATSTSTPWSLLAPSLCGLAVGLTLARAAPRLLRPIVRASVNSPHLGRFLAVRELRRDRAAWRVAAVVTMALSLLCFAVTINQGATSDRRDRAGLIVGAPTVATVSTPANLSVLRAVRRADPAGRWAMAAELIEPFGPAGQRNLAIDASRLPAVAGWTRRIDSLTPSGIASLLTRRTPSSHRQVPVLGAGSVDGYVFALDNTILADPAIHQTSVVPQLLNQGSLTDLPLLIAAASPVPVTQLGNTRITDQVWIGANAPADALQRLRAVGLTIDSVRTRAAVTGDLERGAQAAGLSGYRAVAIVAALLAVALLLGTSAASAARQRSEALALTIAGFGRANVVQARAIAIGGRLLVAGVAAYACGALTAHLAVHLIPQTTAGAVPIALLPLSWAPGVVAVALALVLAFAAELMIAYYLATRVDTSDLRTST